jgi:hypothetical protein
MAIPPPPAPLPDQTSFPIVTGNLPTATLPQNFANVGTYSLASGASTTITNFNSIKFFITAGATLTLNNVSGVRTFTGLTAGNAILVAPAGNALNFEISATDFGADGIASLTVSATGATIYLTIS